jgi:DNA invertase Pin-like site-specific DNA recombinase
MAKWGYLFTSSVGDGQAEDLVWMEHFGCDTILKEDFCDEKLRPKWKQMMVSLEHGDEVVLAKFSNALRGSRELVAFLALCKWKLVRVVSIHDKVDSRRELFPDTSPADLLCVLATLPQETMELRKRVAPLRIRKTKTVIVAPKRCYAREKIEWKEKTVVNMYLSGYDIDDIRIASGFHSRSSIYRVLNKHHIALTRGAHYGPIKKRG